MNTPFFVLQVETRTPSATKDTIKYLTIDSEVGYVFNEDMFRTNRFLSQESVEERLQLIIEASPNGYCAGSLPGRQWAISSPLRSAAGGRIDLDGEYSFVFKIVKLSGWSLEKIKATVVRAVEVKAIQYHNEYDKKPDILAKDI